jgi:hypothetical protein
MPFSGTCGLRFASWSGVAFTGTGRIERSGGDVSFRTEWPTVTWLDDPLVAWLDAAARAAGAGRSARTGLEAL